ncbi:XVIPCD domain-containing protein [Lysobacter sp. 1R34A]|uniref:XVIPCD domain-containing protein n=1 Tax=Lysobacter sp. 1R34A TaxID=3445786 RepID=UPI003EE85BF8
MSYQDTMNVILPPQHGRSAHITGHYGEHRDNGAHGGSDFNYVGGQAGVNLTHPTIHSPVAGTVEFVGGRYGTISIRDAEGNSHQLLHTQSQSVVVGQRVEPGTEIGTMGGRGPRGAEQYAQHVHYQMKDSEGRNLNPETFWNQRQTVGARGGQAAAERPAADDGVLRQGERGADIRAMQDQLNKLGYRDAQGRPLNADGDFGDRTREALLAFQRDQGLKDDGIAGKRTLESLKKSEPSNLLSNSNSPHYAMYQQALGGLEKLGPQAGFRGREDLERAAATLTYEAKVSGLNKIDHVVMSTNGNGLFAVQGGLNDPAHHRVFANKDIAMNQPIEQSSQRLQQDLPQQALTAQQQGQEPRQQQQPPRMHTI